MASDAGRMTSSGCILYQMLVGSPPFRGESQYLTFERIKTLDYSKPDALAELPSSARELILGLLHPEPAHRLGAASVGGPAALQHHLFFAESEPPIDFEAIFALPPPPLVPPPPMPSIEGDSVLNSELASREISLSLTDRRALAAAQVSGTECD